MASQEAQAPSVLTPATSPESPQLDGVSTALSGEKEVQSSEDPVNGPGEMRNSEGFGAEDQEDENYYDDDESDDDTQDGFPSLPIVDDPSSDIRGDLSKVFEQNLEFQGSYYFAGSCPDAPNPCLRIQGLGRVGLPLSDRDAKHIIFHSAHAPFGKGERTLVDPSVRDTWEVDGAKVAIENPKWHSFMMGIVQEVCGALGVHYQKSQPRCELYKLLLYETGSHFLAHQDTEKTAGMFATIIVVLPSEFTGGALHLTHGGLSAIADFSMGSTISTSVAAWYTDITHEVKPVTSGYRLALSYNLIHTTNTLRPSISPSVQGLQRLRHVLLSWQQNLATAPHKIIYLLDHTYAQANLRGSALKGGDAHLVALLNSLAGECQIEFGLASIECHITGTVESDYDRSERNPWSDEDEDDEAEDDDDGEVPEMGEVNERTMSITGLVDMEGRVLLDQVEDEENDEETIPQDLRDEVESGGPDEEEYEGYQGNYAGQIDQWYRRTVFVIWPLKRAEELFDDYSLEEQMLSVLESVKSGQAPNRAQREALDFALKIPKHSGWYGSIARAVCFAAAQWQVHELWTRGFDEFDGGLSVDKLGAGVYVAGIQLLGLDFVLPSLQKALDADPSDVKRLKFLADITEHLMRHQ